VLLALSVVDDADSVAAQRSERQRLNKSAVLGPAHERSTVQIHQNPAFVVRRHSSGGVTQRTATPLNSSSARVVLGHPGQQAAVEVLLEPMRSPVSSGVA